MKLDAQVITHTHTHTHTQSAKPNFSNLNLIKWRDERGEVRTFRLKTSIVHKWKDTGALVGVPRQLLIVWAGKSNDEDSCDKVLSYWLDQPPSRYPATWEGLYRLLKDSQLSEVAVELKEAVDKAMCS